MPKYSDGPSQAEPAGKAVQLRQIPRLNYSILEACHAAGVGRSTLYEAVAAGELRSIKIGKRRLIPVTALTTWLASKEVAGGRP